MILVTGISAVGKTFTISRFVEAHPNFSRLTASQVLSRAGRPVVDIDMDAARSNQLALPHLLTPLDAQSSGRLILDGHAAVETVQGAFPVPDEVIGRLPLVCIVLITSDAASLAIRRQRKGKSADPAETTILQEIERSLSWRWSEMFRLQYHEVASGDHEAFGAAVLSQPFSKSAPL